MDRPHDVPVIGEQAAILPGARYAAYAVGLLCIANAFNIGDRLLLGMMQEPIKSEFKLSDFELGLLGGPAFAILYALLSVPVARIADRIDRVNVVTIALALWSALTGACGLAANYTQLLFARIGISVGEAGAAAPALSYISDLYPPQRRATAMAVFAIGGPAGALLATLTGGRIGQDHGWRASFLVFGAAGMIVALVIRFTLREVRDGRAERTPVPFFRALRVLLERRSYIHVCVAGVYAAFCANFITQYLASFLIRVHGLSLVQASWLVGLASGVFGMVGALAGGLLSDLVSKRRPAARTLVVTIAFAVAAICYAFAFWLPLPLAIPLLLIGNAGMVSYPGVSYAVAGDSAPPKLRATAIALFTVIGNLFGYTLGPPVMGAISDAVGSIALARHGLTQAGCALHPALDLCLAGRGFGLRFALTLAGVLLLGGSLHFWLAGRALRHEREPDRG